MTLAFAPERIEQWPLTRLQHYARNAKQHGPDQVAKIDVQRFKGLEGMHANDLKDTKINPETRKLIRVSIDDEVPGETDDLVEWLMGKKPELRFHYLSESERFAEELDV